jgi:MFS family permease
MTRDLRLLSASLFLWGIGEGMFFYLQPLYLRELGAQSIQIGGILGLAGLASTISHIPAGVLADLMGRKNLMVAAWFAGTAAAWVMYLAPSLSLFIPGLVLYYLSGFVMSPLSSYITAARGEWNVARALTTVSGVFSLGVILGPISGGQLAQRFGLKAIYGSSALLFCVSTLLVLLVQKQPIEKKLAGPRFKVLFRNPALGRLLPLVFITLLATYLSWPLTPNFLKEEQLLSVGIVGLLGSFHALGVVLLNLLLGRLAPRRGFIIAQILVGFSVVMIWQGSGISWLGIGYFMAGGFRTARTLVTAQVQTLVDSSHMGLAYGLAETVGGAVTIIASPIAGILYDLDPELPFPVSLILAAITILIYHRFAPRPSPKDFDTMPATKDLDYRRT